MSLPIACNFRAFNEEQQTKYRELLSKLRKSKIKTDDLPDGFAFHFPDKNEMIMDITEFILLEKICCPFVTFSILLGNNNPVILTMRGSKTIKDVLKAELNL
jgi:hypothetical protein